MSNNKPIRRVAIIGTGVICASWTALFLAKGLDVIATDIAPDAETSLRRFVKAAWPALERLGLAPGASQSVSVSLRGNRSNPGIYEGVIEVTGAGPQLRLPYLYMVSTGVAADAYPILNSAFTGGVDGVDYRIGVRVVTVTTGSVIKSPTVHLPSVFGSLRPPRSRSEMMPATSAPFVTTR